MRAGADLGGLRDGVRLPHAARQADRTLARAVGVAGGCAVLLAAAGGWVLIVGTALAAVYLGFALAGRARSGSC